MKRNAGKKGGAINVAEEQNLYDAGASTESMVRTQIYLTRAEHAFLQAEAERQRKPMSSIIRGFIDAKMEITEEEWASHPLLQPPAEEFTGPEDVALNHDHYVYGAPKLYKKVKGKWVYAP